MFQRQATILRLLCSIPIGTCLFFYFVNKMDIDQEILISLVRDRPVIWDNTNEDYKNRRLKYNAWKDICEKLYPDFDNLNTERKIEFEKLVMKRWINMKDNWIKYNRKINESKSGVKNSRKYLYYDQMLFLKKFIGHRKTQCSINQGDSDDDTSQNSDNVEDNIKRTNRECESPKLNENKKVEPKERYDESSRSMNFFKGIASTVDKFDDESMIEFQFQVISIIRDIKKRERTENTSQYFQMSHAQYGDYHAPSSSNITPPTFGCRSAAKSSSKCSRYDASQQSSSSFRSTTNRCVSHLVKVSNNVLDEHSDVDHPEYFESPPNIVGPHSMDNVDIEMEEPGIKIEIVEDSVGPGDTPDELHSDEIQPEPGYVTPDLPSRKSNLRSKTGQKRKHTKVIDE